MITTEERLIYDMLSAKIGHVPNKPEKKLSAKEVTEKRIRENLNRYKTIQATKKNLK